MSSLRDAGYTVLIVERDPQMRARLKRILSTDRRHRFRLIEADSREGGLRLQPHADCIVASDNLADGDVLDFTVSTDADCVSKPLVVLTESGMDHRSKALRAGAMECLPKRRLTARVLATAICDALERFALQSELQNATRRLRLALEASETGLWEWDKGTDEVRWSAECYAIHGMSPGEFGGTGNAFFQLVHEADQDRVRETVLAALRHRAKYTCEFRIVRPDGKVRWVTNLGRGVYDEVGTPLRMIGTIIDVTESREAAENLQAAQYQKDQSSALLEVFCRQSPMPLAFVDHELRFLRINPAFAALSHTSVEDYLGRTAQEMLPHLWPKLERSIGLAMSDAVVQTVELCVSGGQAGNDAACWRVNVYPVCVDGRCAGLGLLVSDITEQKRHEKSMRKHDQRKDEIVAVVAHELRGPLAPIRAAATLLKSATNVDAVRAKAVAIIDKQAQTMERLVDDILEFGRVQRGDLRLVRQEVDVLALLNDAVETLNVVLESRQQRVELPVPVHQTLMEVDPGRMTQVFVNLLDNASKYSPRHSVIQVQIEEKGTEVEVSILDRGRGIAPEQLGGIFGLYAIGASRADTSRSHGIGLYVARQLVELHGGRIDARSNGVGFGSTFVVNIPRRTTNCVASSGA